MATASNEDEQLKCSVCQNICTGPRKLPECGHYCCEICILIYVSKLRDGGDLDIGFPCPSCKVINRGPKDLKAAIVWIQSLDRGPDRISEDNSNKEQTTKDVCSSCESLGRSSKAVRFCIHCYEALCQPCCEVRHTYKMLKSHKLIDIDFGDDKSKEANKMFQMMCEFISCDTHIDNPIVFFCKDHEEFGCESCVDVIHRQCSDVVKANTFSEQEVINTESETIKASVENLCRYANTMSETKSANTEANKKQVEVIITDLKAIRENANKVFDDLEEIATKNAKCTAKKHMSSAYKDTQILKDMITSSTLSLALMEKLMTYGSLSLQNIIVQKVKERMKSYEEVVLNMSRTFKNIGIELTQENTLLKLLNLGNNNIHELVKVTEKETANCILPFQGRLLLKQYKAKKVKEISTHEKYGKQSPSYGSVMILRNNSIVVVDTDCTCIMIKPNDEVLEPLSLSTESKAIDDRQSASNPVCLARKKEEIIAIPYFSKKKILLISANESITIKREVNTMYQPNAVKILKNGDVAVAWADPVAFGIISIGEIFVDTKVYFRQDKSGRQLKRFQFIAVDERRSHVIQPCTSDNAVYCFDFEGNPKFTYSNIDSPKGVALDGDCNIYACMSRYACMGRNSDCIHVISPSGAGLRIISSSEGCPSYPIAIAFNKDGEEFAVTTENAHVVTVFKLQNE